MQNEPACFDFLYTVTYTHNLSRYVKTYTHMRDPSWSHCRPPSTHTYTPLITQSMTLEIKSTSYSYFQSVSFKIFGAHTKLVSFTWPLLFVKTYSQDDVYSQNHHEQMSSIGQSKIKIWLILINWLICFFFQSIRATLWPKVGLPASFSVHPFDVIPVQVCCLQRTSFFNSHFNFLITILNYFRGSWSGCDWIRSGWICGRCQSRSIGNEGKQEGFFLFSHKIWISF